MEQLTDREILDDLRGTLCRTCDGIKRPKQSHCSACYYKLPIHMRRALYNGFRDGYEAAYRESCEYLLGPLGKTA